MNATYAFDRHIPSEMTAWLRFDCAICGAVFEIANSPMGLVQVTVNHNDVACSATVNGIPATRKVLT